MLENIANIVTILGVGSLGVGALKFLQDHKEKKEADKAQKKFEKLVLLATMRNVITTFSSTKHKDLDNLRYAQYIDGEKKVYTMANEDERNLHYLAYLIVILEDLKYNFDWDQDSFDELNTNIPKILSSIIDQQPTLLALSTSKQIITFLHSVNEMSNHWAIYAFQEEDGEFELAAEIILNQLYELRIIFQWTFVHFFSTITKPTSSSTSSTQATVSESAQSDTKTVAGSAPTTPAQQQDSGVPESSKEMMLNPEYHSNIDENGYNSLLGAYVLDNNNGGNNSNTTTESSAIGSSE